MITVAIASICIGALLALRYKVFVLIPTIIFTCAVLGATGLVREISASQVALEMFVLSTALQLGYLAPFLVSACIHAVGAALYPIRGTLPHLGHGGRRAVAGRGAVASRLAIAGRALTHLRLR